MQRAAYIRRIRACCVCCLGTVLCLSLPACNDASISSDFSQDNIMLNPLFIFAHFALSADAATGHMTHVSVASKISYFYYANMWSRSQLHVILLAFNLARELIFIMHGNTSRLETCWFSLTHSQSIRRRGFSFERLLLRFWDILLNDSLQCSCLSLV